MASLDDVISSLSPALEAHGLYVEGPPRTRPDGFDYQIGLRNEQGVRVVLTLTLELVDDAASCGDVVRIVERSGVLSTIGGAVSNKHLGVRSSGAVFEL